MLDFLFGKIIIDTTLRNGELLEKEGQKKAALILYKNLVQQYPNCKACRHHMGRVAAEIQDANTNSNSPPRPS